MAVEFEQTPTTAQLLDWIKAIEAEVLSDLREFFDEAATPVVRAEAKNVFDTEGYGQWPPLSPQYAAEKARTHPGKTILRREDEFFNAVTTEHHAATVKQIEKDFAVWGVDPNWFERQFGFPYPIAHELGGETLPARPVFSLLEQSDALQKAIVSSFGVYLQKKIDTEAAKRFGA